MIKRHLNDVKILKWVIFALAVLFYFYEYFLRVSPSTMVTELMSSFSIGAASIGVISAYYFYIYALMQIPVGVMMDRFGARSLLTISSMVCGLGALIFGLAFSNLFLSMGRFFQGAGSAFAFLGMVYVCSHWFPASRLAFLVGLGNSLGMLGAAGGEGPLSSLVDAFGWRPTMISFGVVGFLLGFLILFIVRNEPDNVERHLKKKPRIKDLHIGDHLKTVCKNPHSWIVAILCFAIYATTSALAGLWGVPFLQAAYGISTSTASYAFTLFFLGWIVGGPVLGYLSDKMQNRRFVFIVTSFINAVLISVIIYFHLPSITVVYLLLFIVGFFSSSQNLTYCVAIEINPIECKGTAIALTNFINFALASILQPLVGFMLEKNWAGGISHGVQVYTLANFKVALSIFPVFFLFAALLSFFLKEKKSV